MTGHADRADDERILLVMRHAHAESAAGTPDHGRRLTEDGEREANRIGQLLSPRHVPDVAVTSSAIRAMSTGLEVARGSGSQAEVHSSETMYLASVDGLMSEVHALDPSCSTALIVGHQPVVQEFALAISDEDSDPNYLAAISAHFRPATVAVFRYSGLWAELEFGEADLIDVLTV